MIFYLISILLFCFLSKAVNSTGVDNGMGEINSNPSLRCKSESVSSYIDTDWTLIYQPPASVAKNGYFYHSKGDVAGWKWSNKDLKEKDSILGAIINQISIVVKETKDKPVKRPFSYVQWHNNVPDGAKVEAISIPGSASSSINKNYDGNLKGFLVWKNPNRVDRMAMLLVHTLNKGFNHFSEGYSLPESDSDKANFFLCLNVDYKDIVSILMNIMKYNTKIYDKFAMHEEAMKFQEAITMSFSKISATQIFMKANENEPKKLTKRPSLLAAHRMEKFRELSTVGKVYPTKARMIVKFKGEDGDFYQKLKNIIAPNEKIAVKTNFNIPNIYHRQLFCKQKKLAYVLDLNLVDKKTNSVKTWGYNSDEAEFIIGSHNDEYFFCFANTMESGWCKRSGFSICLFDKNLYQTFHESIRLSTSRN